MAACALSNLPYGDDDAREKAIPKIKEIFDVDAEEDDGSYVDHQSVVSFPRKHGTNELNWDYVIDVYEYLKRNGAGVGGGNDNDDWHQAFPGKELSFPGPIDGGRFIGRKSGNQWSLFNPDSGNRLRVRFDDAEPTRPHGPELVDIKITDFCSSNCGYCYQGSTKEGKHAETKDIFNIIDQLADLEVFEIAIGGGEATDHPDFVRICEHAKFMGIVPNLTTRNYNFVRDNYKWCAETLGTIAVSVDNEASVHRVAALKLLSDSLVRFNVQIVCGGVWNIENLIAAATKASIPVTLLGFKEQERGSNFRKMDYSKWLGAVKEHLQYRGSMWTPHS